ncbi:YdeI family protein [Jejudonia soesokkakensis]|uniref:YdeI family protein n=1 Tax=Jejudonia soesokkakensis TaxID=1323432 RepID=A0ABW2MVJ1_9FLAO
METEQKVDAYIKKHSKWTEKMSQIREVLQQTELIEAIKWGAPAYLIGTKIVLGIAGFKNHMGLWFHQGVFLKDAENKLMNAQEDKTKALRQWRFEEDDTIEPKLLLNYVNEAIANAKAGKELKPVKAKVAKKSEVLESAFKKDASLHSAFKNLSPGKQREYSEYIADAKRDTTKLSRLEKIIPMIKEGKGLHDKYKNC